MRPKEKAKEIFDKMYNVDDPMGNYPMCFDTAKQCALIAVDERMSPEPLNGNVIARKYFLYWTEVKNEIEKL